jgi:uncharacterized membrane protein
MDAKAKLFEHPVHQMLIVFPLGLLGMSVVFDVVYMATDDAVFSTVAFWMLVAGLVGGFLAAPFGFIDFLAIPARTRAKRVGALHGGGNLIVTLLFLASAIIRGDDTAVPPSAAYVCSFAGFLLALFTAWLGGELVDRLGIGVYEDANVDAPSSLGQSRARRPAEMTRQEHGHVGR